MVKYEHLTVKRNDRVRVTVPRHTTGLILIAEGPVLSAYSRFVYEPGTEEVTYAKRIGYELISIEMTNDRTNKYMYWKKEDGGVVEKLVDDKYVQVYPIHFEGVVF